MTEDTHLIRTLQNAIEVAEKDLRNSWRGEARVAAIELVRLMDTFSLTPWRDDLKRETAAELDWFYVNGYARALKIFLDESKTNPGYPLFPTSPESQAWAAAALQHSGRIEWFSRAIKYRQQHLAKLRAAGNKTIEVVLAAGAGVESVEREDHLWLSSLIRRIQEPTLQRITGDETYIDQLMTARVYPWREHFIGYTTTPEIDRHFQALGILYSQHLIGHDSFPGRATFNGLPFDIYRAVTATIVGWAMKHARFCYLLKKKNSTTDLANVFTIATRRDDLVHDVAAAVGIDPAEASIALDALTLGPRDLGARYQSFGGAPPLIAIGHEFLLRSAYGWQSGPFLFMLAGICIQHRKDWDMSLALRESTFRSDLYELFRWADVVCLPTGSKLRKAGRVLTDVDAVIFHPKSRTAGLFQLKWQDIFGGSMRMRASRQANLYREASTWLDRVQAWLSAASEEERARGLGLDRFGARSVAHVEMFIIGRHFAHFSGRAADDRAAWALWPQVVRLVEGLISQRGGPGSARDQLSNPISWLAERLRGDSPLRRLPDLSFTEERFELSGITLIVRPE